MRLREGKNREIKKLLAHLGLRVTRLIRTGYGPFQLGKLAQGAVEEMPLRTLARLVPGYFHQAGSENCERRLSDPPSRRSLSARKADL
jgi:23S rRNA pseudouridine2605 synthase